MRFSKERYKIGPLTRREFMEVQELFIDRHLVDKGGIVGANWAINDKDDLYLFYNPKIRQLTWCSRDKGKELSPRYDDYTELSKNLEEDSMDYEIF